MINENISIEITTECNSNCNHCFAKAGISELNTLSFSTIKNITTEAYQAGYRHLHLTGGEPLLHNSFFDILDYSLKLGYKSIFCNSNGTLLTSDITKKLTEYKDKLHFSISLQGKKELHENIRGKNSWKNTFQGINNALNNNLKITIFTSVGKSLLPEIHSYTEYIFKTFKNVNDLTYIQLIRVNNDFYNLKNEVLSPGDFIKLVKTMSMLSLYGFKVSILENPLASVVAKKLGMQWIPESPALHRSGRIIIMADKTIGLSHSTRNNLGLYKKGILKEILSSNRYNNIISHNTKLCPQCKYHNLCSSCGMNRPSEWFRDYDESIPYCQRVLDLL